MLALPLICNYIKFIIYTYNTVCAPPVNINTIIHFFIVNIILNILILLIHNNGILYYYYYATLNSTQVIINVITKISYVRCVAS